MHSASVVLPEPEPPSTAVWRLSTSLLSVMLLLERSARPARMLLAPSPASSSRTESGSSFSSAGGTGVGDAAAGRAAAGAAGLTRPAPRGANRSSRSSCTSARDVGEQLGALEPVGEAGIVAMLGVELAHHHHALPVGDRHQDRAAAALAELAEGLRRLVLLVGRKIARPQHEAVLAHHGRQHAVELALEAAALRRPVAQEDARLGRKARSRAAEARSMAGRSSATVGPLAAVRSIALAPLLARQRQGAGQNVEQTLVVGRDFRLRLGREALPQLAELDRLRRRSPRRGAAAPPKPSAAASVEMKPPLLLGHRLGVGRRPPARACASAPAPGCAAWRGR